MARKKNLGLLGQDLLSTWGHETGMIVNPASEDAAGWDFSVQFELPEPDRPAIERAPLDKKPALAHCLVQVKATEKKDKWSESVKLSNWRHLTMSQLPAFYLILRYKGTKLREAYVVHVGEEWIGRVLKRLRTISPEDEHRLNRRSLSLKWSPEDRLCSLSGEAFRDVLEATVGPDPAAYTERKLSLLRTVGYAPAPYRWAMSMKGPLDEMFRSVVDLSLGLRSFVTVDRFETRELRFGVERPLSPGGGPGEIRLAGLPDGARAVITVRNEERTELIEFPCVCYAPLPFAPFVPAQFMKLRFVAPYIEFIYANENKSLNIDIQFPLEGDPLKLRQAAQAARFLALLASAREKPVVVDIEIHGASQSFLLGGPEPFRVPQELAQVANAILAAWSVSNHFDVGQEPRARLADLLERSDDAHKMVTCFDASFRITSQKLVTVDCRPELGARLACLMAPFVELGDRVIACAAAFIGTVVKVDIGEDSASASVVSEEVESRLLKRWKMKRSDWPSFADTIDFAQLAAPLEEEGLIVLYPKPALGNADADGERSA